MKKSRDVIASISVRQDFFELLRRIERETAHLPRLGESGDNYPARIRIIQPADLAFASRELVSLKQETASAGITRVVIECRHFGLFAPYGALPIEMTEHARSELILQHNQAFQQFLAILGQRLAILHYRAWSQLHVAVGHDRETANAFLAHQQQLVGTAGNTSLNQHVRRVREAFSGAYLPVRKSLKQLQLILMHYFGVTINVLPRHAMWIHDHQTAQYQVMGRLGKTRLGRRFFDVEHAVDIQIGPLPAETYTQFQRGSEKLAAVVAICHDFMQQQIMLNIHLLINVVPEMAMRLGGGRLSQNTWLKPPKNIHKQWVYQA